MTAEELAGSDLSYAPPFSPTYDPVVVAARVASRDRAGAERGDRETEVRDADWYGEDLSGQEHTGVPFVGVDLTEATGDGAVFTDCTFRDCRFNLSPAHRRRLPQLHVHRLLVLPGRVHRLQVRRQHGSSAAPSTC